MANVLPHGQLPETAPQYYYRASECKAKDAYDTDCICWHDEGTGPFEFERPDDPNTFVEWRFKPIPNITPAVYPHAASPATANYPHGSLGEEVEDNTGGPQCA